MPRSSKSWLEARRQVVEAIEAGQIAEHEVMAELGVSGGTLGGWIRAERKLRDQARGESVAQFVPVSLAPRAQERRDLVLRLREGRSLRIPEGFPCAEVVALVRALESSC